MVERIEVKTEVEFTDTVIQEVLVDLGSKLDVKRLLAWLGLDLECLGTGKTGKPWHNSTGGHCRRSRKSHIDISRSSRILHRSNQPYQVCSQIVWLAPTTLDNNLPSGIQDKLRVRSVPQGMLETVLHVVAKPGKPGTDGTLCFLHVQQPFLQREGGHVPVILRVGQGLVDVVEFYTPVRVVTLDRLQTGDIPQERRSRETAKHKDRVAPL